MKSLRLPLTVALTILVVVTVMLWQNYNADRNLDVRTQKALQEFRLSDARVTRDVLLDRAGLMLNYDTLALDRRDLESAVDSLRDASSSGASAARTALAPQLEALSAAVKERLVEVEHFKAMNALLRKSLRYMAYIGPPLIMSAQDQGTARDIGQLSYEVLRYMQVADTGIESEIRSLLVHLERVSAPTSPLRTLVDHGKLIVGTVPLADRLLHSVVNAPTVDKANQLQSAERAYYTGVESDTQNALYLASGLLVALLAYLLYQAARRVASDLQLRSITESTREAIVSVDTQGRVQSWNAGAEDMFGYSAMEMVGQPAQTLMPLGYRAAYDAAPGRFAAGESAPVHGLPHEAVGHRKSGAEFPLEMSLSNWSAFGGRFATGIIRDVSEKKALEADAHAAELRLIQANRMTMLGTLLLSVTHVLKGSAQKVMQSSGIFAKEWSAALPILNQYRHTRSDVPSEAGPADQVRETIPTLINNMQDTGKKMEVLVADLLDFARRPQTPGTNSFRLSDTVERAVRLLGGYVEEHTNSLSIDLAKDLPLARGNAYQFYHVVVNLLSNALESLPGVDRGVSVRTTFDAASNRLSLVIDDEGVGISPEDLARLGTQWYSTRRDRGGTGLGIVITMDLLRDQGGELRYDSELGRGTRAIVTIPAATT